MKAIGIVGALSASAALLVVSGSANASIGLNDLVVFQSGDGTTLGNNAPFSIIELNKSAGQAAPVQAFDISGSSSPMWTSSTASSTGYLSLSQDRTSVQWDAHTVHAATGTNENTITARGVGSIDGTGTYSAIANYTGSSGNQCRSAGLMNGGTLYIGDQGGIYASGASSASVTNNVRNIRVFGDTAYAFQASATAAGVSSISGTPAAPTLTGLNGLGSLGTSVQDFYMISSASDGNFDLLYVATTTGVNKYQLVSGSWTARGTAAVSGGFFGMAAELDPTGGVDLYLTTGSGATNANSVKEFIDSSAASANITLDSGSTLFTVGTGYTLKGIELSPVPAPGAGVLALTGLVALRRRRR